MKKNILISLLLLFVFVVQAQKIEKPEHVDFLEFQREIELTWDKVDDPEIKWEISVNDSEKYVSSTNTFIVVNRTPKTRYNIKIRAFKDQVFSDYVTIKAKTYTLTKQVDDITRIPYLRTIIGGRRKLGQLRSSKILLFYNELAVLNPDVKYFVDGKLIMPNGYELTLPKKGKQKLTILLAETSDRVWELEYSLDVKN